MEEISTLDDRGIKTTYDIKQAIDNLVCHSDDNSHDILLRYLSEESNGEMRAYAKSAVQDIEFNYYWPRTQEERRDFLLARLSAEKYEEMFRAIEFKDKKKFALEKELLRREVANCLPASEDGFPSQSEYERMHLDIAELLQEEIRDAENDLECIRNWINQAVSMITIPKYKSVPKSVFAHVKLDGDEFEWEDNNDEEEDAFLAFDEEDNKDA